MKMLQGPAASGSDDICSAAISHRRWRAAAECRTGTETLATTDATIVASRCVQVTSVSMGKTTPLKKALGL